MAAPSVPEPSSLRAGIGYAAAAYAGWGLFPLFFKLLDHVAAFEILLHRMVWAAPSVLALVLVTGRWSQARAVFADRAAVATLLATALLLSVNWVAFIWAVNAGRVLEASLGYYINPLVSVALGLVFLGERLTRAQAAAVALAAAGVANQIIAVGAAPWASLVMATTFATYGLLRKTVAADARTGLLVETALMAPLAVIALVWLGVTGAGRFGGDLTTSAWLIATGPVTVGPLVLFALGARRLRLSTLGLLQYIAPTMHFITAIAYGEPFAPAQALTFGLIWTGLAVFSLDAWRRDARARRAQRAAALAVETERP